MTAPRKPRVGLALGSGSARGWAHIGVIRALEQAGIRPDIVCGTSIGALVGAAYATGELDRFEQWVLGLGIKDMVGFMDVGLGGGLFKGERLIDFFRQHAVDRPIEQLAMPFAAVATLAAHRSRDLATPWLDARRRACLDRRARIIRARAERRNSARGRRARQPCSRFAGARDGCGRSDSSRCRLGHFGSSPAR